jgi:hypothetical protein
LQQIFQKKNNNIVMFNFKKTNVSRKSNMRSQRKIAVAISGLPSSHSHDGNFCVPIHDLNQIMVQRETKECYSKNQIQLISQSIHHMENFFGGRMGTRYGLKDILSKFSDYLIWMVDQADVDNLEQSGALLLSLGNILQNKNIAVMVYLCCTEKAKNNGLVLPAKEVIAKMKLQKCMPKNVKWTVVEGNAPPIYGYTYDRKTKKMAKHPGPAVNDFKMAQKLWQFALNAKFGSEEFPLTEYGKSLIQAKETETTTAQKASVLEKQRTNTTKSTSMVKNKGNLIQRAFRSLISVF